MPGMLGSIILHIVIYIAVSTVSIANYQEEMSQVEGVFSLGCLPSNTQVSMDL